MITINRQYDFEEFERLFWQLSREMGYQWRKIYDHTFPGSQSHILFLLERNGPQRMSELAEVLHLTPGAVTTASDRLIDQGSIARERDQADRRVTRLVMTNNERQTINKLQSQGRKIVKSVFNDIADKDLEKMIAIFRQATIHIDKIAANCHNLII